MSIRDAAAENRKPQSVTFQGLPWYTMLLIEIVPLVLFLGVGSWMYLHHYSNPRFEWRYLVAFGGALAAAHLAAVYIFHAAWERRATLRLFAQGLFVCAAILEIEVIIVLVGALRRLP